MRYRRRRQEVAHGTELAAALRAARLACRKTMKEVAAEVGVSPRTLHRWETGRTAPPPSRRARLGQALAPLPGPVAERVALSLGLPPPPTPKPPEAHRPFVDERIRIAAERADIRASELRVALASVVADLLAERVPLEALHVALTSRG